MNVWTPRIAAPGTRTGLSSVDAFVLRYGVQRIKRPFLQPRNQAPATRPGVDRRVMLETSGKGDMVRAARLFAAHPNIEAAMPDGRAFPATVPSDPLYTDHRGHNNTP